MKSIAKSIGIVMVIMLFSRLLALLSNISYMTAFGVNIDIDIYSYALNLPNIIFNSFGTALTTVVIPVFAGYIGAGEKERAFKFADNVISLSFVFTAGLSLLGLVAAPFILVMIPRFRIEGYDFAVMAFRIMLPVMIFYALNYILQGILQSLGRYNMPAFVSVPGSLIIIAYVYIFGTKYGVKGLIVATFIGLSLQALILIPPLFKTGYRFCPSFDYKNEDIKRALRLIPPVLIGTSAYQLNMLFNTTMSANFKDAVAIMTSVQNLILYAVLAFIYSVTAVVFPRFAMLASQNDMEGFKRSLLKVLKTVIYFLVPASAGFIVLGHQLFNLLYGWKKITPDNISLAAAMMSLYAAGITGIGLKEVIDRAFYSLKDTKKPAFNGVVMMAVNIAAAFVLIRFTAVRVLGIPAAYSISALTGVTILMFLIRKKIGNFGEKNLFISAFKVITASVIMLIVIIPLNLFLKQFTFGYDFFDRSIKLFIPVILGGSSYLLVTCLLKVEEAIDVLNKVKKVIS